MIRARKTYIRGLLLALLLAVIATGCDVHEWPELPEKVPYQFHLKFETDMPIEYVDYTTRAGGISADLEMRYIVRAYPVLDNGNTTKEYVDELVFTRPITDDYDVSFMYDLPEGKFTIRVWADFVKKGGQSDYLYDTTDFSEISLLGDHYANSDDRDAFRGTKEVTLVADIMDRDPEETTIEMLRPMGKFEFITTDLDEFIDKQLRDTQTKGGFENLSDEEKESIVNLDDYHIVFFYYGFMPNAYSMITDKPVDAVTGVQFSTKLTQLSSTEASMGFDYLFVNGHESQATVVIGIYNQVGEQLGMTAPIDVPIKRGIHTVVKGKYLLENNQGGVNINPDFDGDFNIVIP